MAWPEKLQNMSLPVIGAPLFIISNPDLVVAQCTNGVIVPLFVLAALLIAWGLQPKRTEESIGRLPYGSSYILKALAKLDSMLLDEQKNVVAPDEDYAPQSAVMQPTAPAYRSLVSWR